MGISKPLQLAIKAAEEKKAMEIKILNIAGLTTIADYFVVMSGTNKIQTRAIADAIQASLAEQDMHPYRKQGNQEGDWILLDYIDFVIHVFLPASREYYQLERLWSTD